MVHGRRHQTLGLKTGCVAVFWAQMRSRLQFAFASQYIFQSPFKEFSTMRNVSVMHRLFRN